jgi:hypothetical protein
MEMISEEEKWLCKNTNQLEIMTEEELIPTDNS